MVILLGLLSQELLYNLMNIALHLTDVLAKAQTLTDGECSEYRFITVTLRKRVDLLRTKMIFTRMLCQVHDIIGKNGDYVVKLELTKMGTPHLHYLYRLPVLSRRIAALDSIRRLGVAHKYGGLILGFVDIKCLKTHGDVMRVYKYIQKEIKEYTELLAPVKLSPLYTREKITALYEATQTHKAIKKHRASKQTVLKFFKKKNIVPYKKGDLDGGVRIHPRDIPEI